MLVVGVFLVALYFDSTHELNKRKVDRQQEGYQIESARALEVLSSTTGYSEPTPERLISLAGELMKRNRRVSLPAPLSACTRSNPG